MTIHIVRSVLNRNAWKVWVTGGPNGSGYLRGGFAWRTWRGAANAAKRFYPNCTAYSVEPND